jgi:hypothetical protein
MSLPFDATLKNLAREHLRALLAAFDATITGSLRLLNVDLSTVTTSTDGVIGLGDLLRGIVHFDFQAKAAAAKHADMLWSTTPSCTGSIESPPTASRPRRWPRNRESNPAKRLEAWTPSA